MAQPERFDCLVFGSGHGGMYLAWHLAGTGRRTAVVERRWVGGACPNANCLPSKNEIWSAKVADLVRHAARFGSVTGPVSIDMGRVLQRKRDMVAELVAGNVQLYKATGAELIMGVGRFVAPKTLEVRLNDGGTRLLTADQVIIDIGTHATIPNVPGLEASEPLTNVEALELDQVPPHLVVIGGGFVGLELAQAYRRFGSHVTIVHHGARLADREDPDVSEEIQRILEAEEIDVLLSAETRRVEGRSGRRTVLTVRTASGERTLEASHILVAAGRAPNTVGVGLEQAGVEVDGRGYIKVNDRLETTAPGVWAMGECAGSPQFTHVSYDDFRVIRDNLAGLHHSTRDRLVPYCIFTDPQLARVGLNETEARRRGIEVRVARLPANDVARTRTTDERRGFLKAIVGAADDRILGFTMIGADAGEVMAVVQVAMLAGLPSTQLREAILAHPTMAEGLGPLFESLPSRSV